MIPAAPEILESLRLPALYAAVLRYAGVPAPSAPTTEHFTVRSGTEPPGLLATLLEEALLEDAAEAGFGRPYPDADGLRGAARRDGGPVQLFAVERRDGEGRLRSVTWVAVPEQEPPPVGAFRAAVLREAVGE